MGSLLVITPVEKLQGAIVEHVRKSRGQKGVYVSLNKTQASTAEMLSEGGIDTNQLFFIDCVTTTPTNEDVLHIKPDDLEMLGAAIRAFLEDIGGERFVAIDALSTLLIYNSENAVAKFVKEVSSHASRQGVTVLAFSPQTKGEELLEKIFNFFDTVEK